ncbi:ABC transporter permease [Bacteroidota bacterium]
MIKFLFKGLIRDRHKSLVPALVVAAGVLLTVLFHAWFTGIMEESIEFNARFSTGHVKIVTNAYEENMSQVPNDLALMGVEELKQELENRYPDMLWAERIMFGGLIDAPDENGETKSQGPASGFGIDMLSGNNLELERMNIIKSIKSGHAPTKAREILISQQFADKLKVGIGDQVTLIGSSMYGEMAMYNFTIAGTVEFGSSMLDKGAIIADINDVRMALNMEDASGEVLGFLKSGYFNKERSDEIIADFNSTLNDPEDEFSPKMISLRDQSTMAVMIDFAGSIGSLVTFVFVLIMAIVLWNAGLLGGLRRYGEFGVRLAIGEEKKHIYMTLIYESVLIGIIGSTAGTALGLVMAFYLQNHGLDVSGVMKDAAIMMPSVFRAKVTATTFYIGFIPGVLSTILGSALAGIGIYKRKTAQLFKELEA